MKKTRGFTLIELLVVISIIALLLAILMPALSKVKEKARDVMCRTNIKTMQLATMLYTEENKGKMPRYDLNGLWVNLISDYLENVDQARYCASTKVDKQKLEDPTLDYTLGKFKGVMDMELGNQRAGSGQLWA